MYQISNPAPDRNNKGQVTVTVSIADGHFYTDGTSAAKENIRNFNFKRIPN